MSAFTLDSGSFSLISRTSKSNDDKRSDDTPRPSHWLSAGALCLAGVGLAALAAILFPISMWAEANGLGGVGHGLMLGISACLLCAAAGALVGAWMVATIRAQHRHDLAVWAAKVDERLSEVTAEVDQATTAMACTMSRIRVALDELPDQVWDRVERRIAAIEQRQEEQDEEYERGWVDGAAKIAETVSGNGHGKVTQLRSPPPPRR